MFYSQTYLARNGPLSTVWCAAHLQHRLKKSHYTSTDIPSTVERIIYPEAPIALRLSGHLLLGVVRIYSKKVDYLVDDCKVTLNGLNKTIFYTTKKVDLPENEMQAPVQAITRPDTFCLDALNLDYDTYNEGSPDNHFRNEEDIRLPEQIPTGSDPYVAITFDEDMEDVLQPEAAHDSGDRPMDEEMDLPGGHLNQTESPSIIREKGIPQDFPEIEVRRDAVHDLGNEGIPPGHSDQRNNAAEIPGSLDQILDDKEIHTPNVRSASSSGGEPMPFHEHPGAPTSAAIEESPRVSFGHESPQLAIQPSPPAQQPRKKRKRHNIFFDNELVLSNKFMKKALEDTNDLVRKKSTAHSSALAVWKSKNSLQKEQVFNGPSSTGMCAELSDMFSKDYIFARPNLAVLEEALPNREIPQSPPPNTEPMDFEFPATATATEASLPEIIRETECLRDDQGSAFDNVLHGFEPSPSRPMSSPRRGDSPPTSLNSLGPDTVPDVAASTGTSRFDFKTPSTLLEEEHVEESTGLSDIPEMVGSAEGDELFFLEADNVSPNESQASQGVDSLSVRTRAVAQYLKRQSPISENSSEDLSLKKILEGKTRKMCARMFYETLVLKSYGLIDVEQEQPYQDITLKLTSMLSKVHL